MPAMKKEPTVVGFIQAGLKRDNLNIYILYEWLLQKWREKFL